MKRLPWEGKRGQAPYVRSTLRAVPANGVCPLFPIGISCIVMLATAFVFPASTRAGEAQRRADFHVRWAEQAFAKGPQPFSFSYGGRRSADVLGKWKRKERLQADDAAVRRRTITFTDPETGLEVRVEAAIYLDTPSVEWTLYFTNRGKQNTPVLEQVNALDVTVPLSVSNNVKFHRLMGSAAGLTTGCRWKIPFRPAGKWFCPRPQGGRLTAPVRSSICNGTGAA